MRDMTSRVKVLNTFGSVEKAVLLPLEIFSIARIAKQVFGMMHSDGMKKLMMLTIDANVVGGASGRD